MGKQHLGRHVVVGYGIKIFWPGLFITSPDHLADMQQNANLNVARLQHESRVEELQQVNAKLLEKTQGK